MSGARNNDRPTAASVDEDPNAVVQCSSPPCFMHELDPSYLGYLSREEVSALLATVLAADWAGAVPDEARLRAALRRHRGAASGPPRLAPGELVRTIREALPRIQDHALRRDLEEVLGALESPDGCRQGKD